jgi:predicted AAA+ superfamily ATPase
MEPVLRRLAGQYPVVTVTGPRQSGKTTLCRYVFPDKPYVNLETPDVRRFAMEDPRGFLGSYPEGAILDEIQRTPELLSYIQPLVDEHQTPGQYILTGSQQLEVMDSVSQSLAGRTALLKLLPLSLEELSLEKIPSAIDRIIQTGFYPRIHDKGLNPSEAMANYFETYVERDIRRLIAVRDLSQFEKFVRMCAGRVGQLLNLQGLAADVGISHTTARSWLSLLEASYIVFVLQPWFTNTGKRLVKTPKLYFYDVGLAAWLLGIESEHQVSRDPLRGNLFENMVVMEVLKHRFNRGLRSNLHFYRDSKGNEVDLLLEFGADVFPLEIKSGATVASDFFKGLKSFASLGKSQPWKNGLVYGGLESQQRSDVTVCSPFEVHALLSGIGIETVTCDHGKENVG